MFDFEDINEISGLLPMRVVFQHLPNKSTSIYNVEFPVKSPVHRLKIDIAQRVKIRPEFQKWNYKGRVLDDKDTILNLRIKRDETIFIQQTGPPTQRQQQQQKKQQSTSDDYKLSENEEVVTPNNDVDSLAKPGEGSQSKHKLKGELGLLIQRMKTGHRGKHMIQQEAMDDLNEYPEKLTSEPTHVILVHIILQISRSGVWPDYQVQLPMNIPICNLKKDFEKMLNIPFQDQIWLHKQRQLDDSDCIQDLKIARNDYIQVIKKE